MSKLSDEHLEHIKRVHQQDDPVKDLLGMSFALAHKLRGELLDHIEAQAEEIRRLREAHGVFAQHDLSWYI